MKINYFVHTEIGDRPCNEDRYAVSKCPAGLCFALADGLGGLDRGEVAAELACNAVAEYAQAQAVFSNAAVEQAFLRAQQAVLARQKAEHNETQMKTTLNIVMLDKQNMYWGHVGDSRTYYAENGVLKQRTLDHSVTQMLSAIGQVEERDIRFHEDRSRLLRVLGTPWEKPQAETEQPWRCAGTCRYCSVPTVFGNTLRKSRYRFALKNPTMPKYGWRTCWSL